MVGGLLMRAASMACAALLVASLAQGQSPVTWTVTPGFGGLYQANAWTPVTVKLTNSGPATRGELVIPVGEGASAAGSVVPSGPCTYTLPVDLPRQSHKQYTLCVPASGLASVYLKLGSGAAKQDLPATARQLSADDELVVVVGGEGTALSPINGTSVPVPDGFVKTSLSITKTGGSGSRSGSSGGRGQRVKLKVALGQVPWPKLPDSWLAWDGVGAAVLADAHASLAPAGTVEALARWVRLGGKLIVPGGAAGAALRGTALGPLLPLEVTGTTAVSNLHELGAWTGQAAPTGPALMVRGKLRPGAKVLAGELRSPLVLYRRVGNGQVIMPLFDFTANPVKYWPGQTRLWELLLSAGLPAGPARGLEGQFIHQGQGFTSRFAQTLPQNRQPSQPLLFGFLLVYVLVLSPGQYLLLKRWGRTELAWIITPAIVVFFCLAAYGLTAQLRGREVILQRLAVVETASGSPQGRGLGWAGLFSSAPRSYALRLGPGAAGVRLPADQQEGAKPTVRMGPEAQLRDFGVSMWSLRACGVEFAADLGQGLEVVEAGWDGQAVQLRVRNRTRLNFKDCRILYAGAVTKCSALKADETLRTTFTPKPGSAPAGPGMSGMPPSMRSGSMPPFGPSTSTTSSSTPEDPAEIMVTALAQATNPGSMGGSLSGSSGGLGYSYSYSTTLSGSARPQAYFVAITSDPLLPVEPAGSAMSPRDVGIVMLPIEVRLKGGQSVRVPDWLIQHQTLFIRSGRQITSTVYSYGTGPTPTTRRVTHTEQERTTLFELPTGPDGGALTSLAVSGPYGGFARVRLFNHQTDQWDASPARARVWQVGSPAAYMDGQGRVLVRDAFSSNRPPDEPVELNATIHSRQGGSK